MMLAHYHAQTWNAAELARAVGTSGNAVRHYLDVLTGAFMVRQLPPWFENVGKRVVKSAKVYLRDSGLLHALLGLEGRLDVYSHPKLGASWEGFALDQTIRLANAERDSYFWATQRGAELDLLIARRGKRFGFELKHQDTPRVTKSMRVAVADLALDHLFVVHPGAAQYALDERISAVGLGQLEVVLREQRLRS